MEFSWGGDLFGERPGGHFVKEGIIPVFRVLVSKEKIMWRVLKRVKQEGPCEGVVIRSTVHGPVNQEVGQMG